MAYVVLQCHAWMMLDKRTVLPLLDEMHSRPSCKLNASDYRAREINHNSPIARIRHFGQRCDPMIGPYCFETILLLVELILRPKWCMDELTTYEFIRFTRPIGRVGESPCALKSRCAPC